jgi:hypothetical protein
LKWILKNAEESELHPTDLRYCLLPIINSSNSIKGREFLEKLSDSQILKDLEKSITVS